MNFSQPTRIHPDSQPSKQSVNLPVKYLARRQPVNQPASQSASQPVNQPASQSASQSISQPVNQPVSQPPSQPYNRAVRGALHNNSLVRYNDYSSLMIFIGF